jgi:tetratricopeptide (TPR) repeat protein
VRSYAEELELARELLEQGDRAHSLHHCVAALVLEPHRREWSATLRELLTSKELVAKLEADTFFGSRAALAVHQRETGHVGEAMQTISQVATAVPELGFHRWFVSWLQATPPNVPVQAVKRILMLVTTFGVGRIRLLPAELAAAEELVPVAEYALRSISDSYVLWLSSATFRRAGRYDRAIEAGAKARPGLPPDIGGTALALALRANGDFDLACDVFDEIYAKTREPDFLHEKKRVLADAGRWEEALEIAKTLEKTTELGSENLAEHGELRARLAANAPPPDVPPFDLVCRRANGHGTLLPMVDATANGLRNFAKKQSESSSDPTSLGALIRGDSATIAISGNEGASNRLAQALMFAGVPDPRLARYSIATGTALQSMSDRSDQYSLWKLDGDVVVQALPAPPDAVLDWVERLALLEPDGTAAETIVEPHADFLDMWRESKQLPRVAATAREWVAAAIYPRMPLFRVALGPDWVYRWQVAALIGLARSESAWSSTQRRDAFLSLLDGAIDWPLAAAIRVVTEIALEEPDTTSEIRTRLITLSQKLDHVPNSAIPATLLHALAALPYVSEDHTNELRAKLKSGAREGANDTEDPIDDDPDPQEPSSAPNRPWWQFWKR